MRVDSKLQIEAWLVLNPGVKQWMIQDYLPGDNLGVTQVWWCGKLRGEICIRRDKYMLPQSAPSGISGEVADMVTVNRPDACEVASRAVRAVASIPEGIYGVDLRDDRNGIPRVTEINARMAGRPELYPHAGVNIPAIWVSLLYGGNPAMPVARPGVRILRHTACDPIIVEDDHDNGDE